MSRTEPRNYWRWCLLGAALVLHLVLATCAARAADLNVDGGATYTVTSDVTFANAYIGNSSTGTVNQANFTNDITGNLFLGYNSGSTGVYNLSGGILSVVGGAIVGHYGSGVFTQSGGANACGNLVVGNEAGSSGVYNQSGGTNTLGGNLFLGYKSGSSGVYNLSGGSLVAAFASIGYQGSGVFTQNGGANNISNNLYVGESAGGSGIYNLNSGSLRAPNQLVGFHGTGIFNQNGGSNTVTKNISLLGLILGSWYDGNGTYNLNNGSLTSWSEIIGMNGVGTFNQSNGTNQVTEVLALGLSNTPNASGTYNLSGGQLSAADEVIGYNGTGTFNQTGGSHTVVNDLVVGFHFTANGVYNLSSGSLSVLNEYIGYTGQGSFVQTGGVHSVSGDLTLGYNSLGRGSLALLGGSLSVGGNYTQNANSSLALGIVSPSNYQQLQIGGTASLNGTLTPVVLGERPRANQVYTGVLTTAGGLTGTFTLTDPWINPTLYWQQLYHADRLDLRVNRDYDHPGLGLNSNQGAVGFMLNNLAGTATGDLDISLNAIDNLPTVSGVQDAYKQISPEKATALTTLGFAGATFQVRNLANRITNLRFGVENSGRSRSLGGLDLTGSRQSGVMLAYNGAGFPGLLSTKKPPGPENRWGVYADGGAAFGAQQNTVNQTGYDFTLAGFTAGGDYRVTDQLLLGLATGYSHTAAGFKGSGGTVNANTWPLNAYAAYFPGSFYAYGSVGYALNLFDLDRGLNFGGLARDATSSTTGHQFNAYGEMGYDLRLARAILTPAATLAYSRIWVDPFTEEGAGSLSLHVGPQNADSLQTGVGGRLTLPLKAGRARVVPQVYAFYQHEFANGSRGLNAALSQAGSTFNFQSDAPARDFAILGATLAGELRQNLWARVNYSAEVGRGGYTAHYLQAGLRWEF